MDLSFIIVTYNSKDQIRKLLDSINKYTKRISYEIIVIDNNSQDETLNIVAEYKDKIRIIKNKVNLGFAAANNLGFRFAVGSVIAMVNPDVWMDSDVFSFLFEYIRDDRNIGVLGCKSVFPDGSTQTSTYAYTSLKKIILQIIASPFRKTENILRFSRRNIFNLFKGKIIEAHYANTNTTDSLINVDVVTGACMVFRKDIIKDVGYWDEKMFLYYEDEDFCRRVNLAGFAVKYCSSLKIFHRQGWKQNMLNPMLLSIRYNSLQYYCKKYYSKNRIYFFSIIMLNDIVYILKRMKIHIYKYFCKNA